MDVPGTPVNTPDFINHYINQYVSEECIIKLNKLSHDYLRQKKELDRELIVTKGNREEYRKIYKREPHDPITPLLKKLEQEAKQKALNIAKQEGQINHVEVIEWKEPEHQKSIDEKSQETETNLKEVQDIMIERKEQYKIQQKADREVLIQGQIKESEQNPSVVLNGEELLEMLAKDKKNSQQQEQSQQTEKFIKEQQRTADIEKLRQQFAQNRELYKGKER